MVRLIIVSCISFHIECTVLSLYNFSYKKNDSMMSAGPSAGIRARRLSAVWETETLEQRNYGAVVRVTRPGMYLLRSRSRCCARVFGQSLTRSILSLYQYTYVSRETPVSPPACVIRFADIYSPLFLLPPPPPLFRVKYHTKSKTIYANVSS